MFYQSYIVHNRCLKITQYILLENILQRWLQKHEANVTDIRLLDIRINIMNNAYLRSYARVFYNQEWRKQITAQLKGKTYYT